MYTIRNYVMADSLEQAYEWKQKGRNNVIIGGNLWLKMGHRAIQNAIDLSRLGLDQIEEDAEGFRIGCMVTLRQLEVHEGLRQAFGSLFRRQSGISWVCSSVIWRRWEEVFFHGLDFRTC